MKKAQARFKCKIHFRNMNNGGVKVKKPTVSLIWQ